jgi:hypothetical protein
MSKLLIKNTVNVKGAILDVQDMINICAHYRRASVQEVVYDNTPDNVDEEEALKIADRAIGIMDDTSFTEQEAINEALTESGYDKVLWL